MWAPEERKYAGISQGHTLVPHLPAKPRTDHEGRAMEVLFLAQRYVFPLRRALPLSILIHSTSLLAFLVPYHFSFFSISVCYYLAPLISKCCPFWFVFQIFSSPFPTLSCLLFLFLRNQVLSPWSWQTRPTTLNLHWP